MEANEMPEKVFLFDYNDAMVTPLEGDTVYIREDAFVDKACSWLENNLQGIVGGSIYIEDFRKYMKGE